jgi:putative ABC transport system permease protein
MNNALQDLRVAARQLARQPSFALIFIVTLALGIGAATTCFSVLNAVALRPIPFSDPDQLVAIDLTGPAGSGRARLTVQGLRALAETQGVFAGYVGFTTRFVTAAAGDGAERVPAAEISGDIFSLLGIPVQVGRPLRASDAAARVIVIASEFATRAFGTDVEALGRTVSVNGDKHVVVGVARRGFSFPQDSRVWLPLPGMPRDREVEIVARIESAATTSKADAVVRAASASILSADGGEHRVGWTAAVLPLREIMLGTKHRDMALFVLSASALVLLIACANLAGLLTAYLAGRKHEVALRAAIGASRTRLVRQLMTESMMLAATGGALGLLLAQWGVAVFASTLGKPRGAEWIELTVDGRVLLFALLASALTAVLFGMAPAIRGSRADLRTVLQEDGRTAGSHPRGRHLRSLLVAGQISVSIALLAGAASIVTSTMRFGDIDPGFDRNRLLLLRAALANRAYEHPEQRLAFVDAAVTRLRSLPGAASVTAASHVPLADRDVPAAGFLVEGMEAIGRPPFATYRFVDADYLDVMRIRIHRGRAFTTAEARDLHADTVVINDTMAHRYWPDRDPVGARVRLVGASEMAGWYTVVGVVADVAQRQLPAAPENQIYLPLAGARELTFAVRAWGDAGAIATAAREAIRGVDESLAVEAQTMTAVYGFYVNDRRLQGMVLGTIGATAVLIAALGLYGIVSLMVVERSRELAIRSALGASKGAVMRLVLRRGVGLAMAGIVAGCLLATALTTFLSSVFLGVRAFDGLVLGTAAALLGAVAVTASWWPARRAMRVDPMSALKQ